MASGLAQHLDEQVRTAIDDLRVIAEIGLRIDHAEQLDHGLDAAQFADRRLRRREQPETGEPRMGIALLDRGIAAKAADTQAAVRGF